ncbi:DUF3331 domain-containing protein [Burkholderia metallica]|uniref:DUF3331 domain-containing protein n=2 Tax=Burkholderia metallica TaxID=488729 RepID=UPI0031330CDD
MSWAMAPRATCSRTGGTANRQPAFIPHIPDERPAMTNDRSFLHISLVEQLSPTMISISWSNPCLGHYTDQVWRVGLAHAESVCMLSGEPIRPGDTVFRPRTQRSRVPINHNRMILASAVAVAFPDSIMSTNTET